MTRGDEIHRQLLAEERRNPPWWRPYAACGIEAWLLALAKKEPR